MKKIEHICFIVPNYPTKNDPVYTFVRELICSIADSGIKCTVIAPQSITNFIIKRKRKRPYFWEDYNENNYKIDIYQPIHAPFLNFKLKGSNLAGMITQFTVVRTFNKINQSPDTLYAHFWHSGVVAGHIGNNYNLPVFIASGESKIWVEKLYSKKKILRSLESVRGVISVSRKNMLESTSLGLASRDKIKVIPNSVNNKVFYKMNKREARKKLGFAEEDFIVAFTGSFNYRKGVLRLEEALKKNPGVKSLFIGSGELVPQCENILFQGKLPHNQVVTYLNAADIFVLPTLAEGCCNAIIEAMACGLPIISSNLSFNDDILDDQNSIRVDSKNIDELAKSIQYLKDNKDIRDRMAASSLVKAKELDIQNRSRKIVDFLRENL